MAQSLSIQAAYKLFEVSLRGFAWQPCDSLVSVDGTIEIVARPAETYGRGVVGIVHGHLSRPGLGVPFVVPFSQEQVRQVIEYGLTSNFDMPSHRIVDLCDDLETCRIDDARWRMEACSVPQTLAALYAGAAMEFLETHLHLGSAAWMQDWPNEVSDHKRVEESCAFYDQQADPKVRFDTMALALTSFADRVSFDDEFDPDLTQWFDQTLRQDFALHGHTVERWARLDRDQDDSEFQLTYPEFVSQISGMMRRIWEEMLVPIEVDWSGVS